MKIEFPISLNEFYVSLETGPCEGTCPIYIIKIHGSGKVDYLGIDFVKQKGKHSKIISKTKVLSLFKKIIELEILELNSNYSSTDKFFLKDDMIECYKEFWTCLSSTSIEIKIGKKVKKIYDYQGAPKRLKEFEKLIDKICSVNDWIGDKDWKDNTR